MVLHKGKIRRLEMAKSTLLEKKMPHSFWSEAIKTAVYLLNICPIKTLEKMNPFEAFSGKKLGVKHPRVFYLLCTDANTIETQT